LPQGVNFINILRAAFAPVDPKSVKRYWQLDLILKLLGSMGVKAVSKYVGEIEPRSPHTQPNGHHRDFSFKIILLRQKTEIS